MMCGNGGCGKCSKSKMLCPISLGLALGITSALSVFIWALGMIYFYNLPPGIAPTLSGGGILALRALLKGFLFGFFLALFYDFFACCMKSWCRRKMGETGDKCGCDCGCKSCGMDNKPPVAKM